MKIFVKTAAVGAIVCGAISANALAAEAMISDHHTNDVTVKSTPWQENSVVDNFYQGDFQQLGRTLQQNPETKKMYTGDNSVAVPTAISAFL